MKNTFESSTLIFAIVAFSSLLSIMAFLLIFYSMRESTRSKHYDFELRRAELSGAREYYERSIGKAVKSMTSTKEGWLDANHLIISGAERGAANQSKFLSSFGLSEKDLAIDDKSIFVLTPFAEEDMQTFLNISEICQSLGFTVVRGDEVFTSGDILGHIVKLMVRSRFVIANVATRNANVFYELGIAHALGKQTVLVSNNLNSVPFDLKNNRIVIYNTDLELKVRLTESLVKVLSV